VIGLERQLRRPGRPEIAGRHDLDDAQPVHAVRDGRAPADSSPARPDHGPAHAPVDAERIHHADDVSRHFALGIGRYVPSSGAHRSRHSRAGRARSRRNAGRTPARPFPRPCGSADSHEAGSAAPRPRRGGPTAVTPLVSTKPCANPRSPWCLPLRLSAHGCRAAGAVNPPRPGRRLHRVADIEGVLRVAVLGQAQMRQRQPRRAQQRLDLRPAPRCAPWVPQAQMTLSAQARLSRIAASFSGPTGSGPRACRADPSRARRRC
jgi:hypothetical protein